MFKAFNRVKIEDIAQVLLGMGVGTGHNNLALYNKQIIVVGRFQKNSLLKSASERLAIYARNNFISVSEDCIK